MNILVSGSTGLVGSVLVSFLSKNNHNVIRLVRNKSEYIREQQVLWNPELNQIESEKIENIDAVIHLAGESIDGIWTKNKKEKILESRVKGTRLLSETISKLKNPPKVFISASAIGYYGNRGNEKLYENSENGNLFLSEVCKKWEEQTQRVSDKGIRVVNLRIGVVLSDKGGALAKMLLPFKMGLGGKLGSGKQYMSWILLDDLIGVINHSLINEDIHGALNAVAPNAVTNSEFTNVLGKVLKRPAFFSVPYLAGKFVFGEMGDELLFSSTNVSAEKLLKSGYRFKHNDLYSALKSLLSENKNTTLKHAGVHI